MTFELKHFIFIFLYMTVVPSGYLIVKKYPWAEKICFFLMIFFTCEMVDINFFSHETYRGSARGFETGMVDIANSILLLLVLHRRHKYPLMIPPGSILFGFYFLFSFFSLFNAAEPLFSGFELWKMLRMYLYFWVIFNYARHLSLFSVIIKSFAIVILYCAFEVLKQKYAYGLFQAKGPFPHQNSMVMYMIVSGSMIYSYLLNAAKDKLWFWFLVFGLASFCVVASLSRAGLALYALSIIIITLLSFTAKFSMKKVILTLLLIIGGAIALAKASDSIIERVATAPEESKLTRVNLAIAAQNMANDKFFGVGLNNFGIKINPPYPYGDHIKRSSDEDKGGLVETVYLMIAAETGWLNLIVYLLLLITMYIRNFRNYWRWRKTSAVYFPAALIGALTAIYLESSLEWVLKQTNNFYQLMFVFAITSFLSTYYDQLKKQGRELPKN